MLKVSVVSAAMGEEEDDKKFMFNCVCCIALLLFRDKLLFECVDLRVSASEEEFE